MLGFASEASVEVVGMLVLAVGFEALGLGFAAFLGGGELVIADCVSCRFDHLNWLGTGILILVHHILLVISSALATRRCLRIALRCLIF